MAAELGDVLHLLGQRDLQVMARHRLVQGQGLHLPARPAGQVVGVGEEVAGPARGRRSGLVVGRGLRLLGVGGHGLHAVGQPRQPAEQPHQLRVGALADVAVGGHQVVRPLEVEPRVGPQEPREFVERPAEAGGPDGRVHAGADALDLREAQAMDLVRGERRGRVLADAPRVPGLAVGQRPHRDRFAGRRDVGVDQEVVEPPVRGRHVDGVRPGGPLAQPLGLRRGNGFRDARERAQQRALARVVDDLVPHLLRHVAQGDPRRGQAGGQPFLHEDDGLVHEVGHGFQARQDVLEVRGRGRGHQGQDLRDVLLHAVHLGEGHELAAEAPAFDGLLRLALEHVVVELVRGREARAVDGAEGADR